MTTDRRRAAFTLIELLVVIAIIAILAAILFPVFSKAREKGRQSNCANNERSLILAALMYSEDYGTWPPDFAIQPTGGLMPYTDGRGVFHCPSHDTTFDSSYAWNSYIIGDSGNNIYYTPGSVLQPSKVAAVWDGAGNRGCFYWYNNGPNSYGISQRHNGYANIGFADGHVKSVNTMAAREIGLAYNDGNYMVQSSVWPPHPPGTVWADQWAAAEFWTPYYLTDFSK